MQNCSDEEGLHSGFKIPRSAVHLLPTVQCYLWGTKGSDSVVAKLMQSNMQGCLDELFHVDESTHYAELWMGVHPLGISRVILPGVLPLAEMVDYKPLVFPGSKNERKGSSINAHQGTSKNGKISKSVILMPLNKFLVEYPYFSRCNVPKRVQQKHSLISSFVLPASSPHEQNDMMNPPAPLTKLQKLPFLLKILAISTPLSIQAHPDEISAKRLFEKFPTIYTDSNPKPELSIALGGLEVLCGFRSPLVVAFLLKYTPEMRLIIGDHVYSFYREKLEMMMKVYLNMPDGIHEKYHDESLVRDLFIASLKSPQDIIVKQAKILAKRIKSMNAPNSSDPSYIFHLHEVYSLFLRFYRDFPNDSGIFGCFFLDYIQLKHGEAIFIPPNKLHSYLSGHCIECMTNSDNVVRAGLTKKFKDIDLLTEIIQNDQTSVSIVRVEPKYHDRQGLIRFFKPTISSIQQFQVMQIELSPKQEILYTFSSMSATIGIVLLTNSRVSMTVDNISVAVFQGATILFQAGSSIRIINDFVCPQLNNQSYDVLSALNTFLTENSKASAFFLMFCATCGDYFGCEE